MSDWERFTTINSVTEAFDRCMDDMIGQADTLEEEGYEEFGERAREIACQIDDLSHDVYQQNKKDNH